MNAWESFNVLALGAVSGAASMLIYARLSPQELLKQFKLESADLQKTLSSYDGDFQGALLLARRNLQLSLRRLGCALVPSLFSSAPVLLALILLPGHYLAFLIAAAIGSLGLKLALRIE